MRSEIESSVGTTTDDDLLWRQLKTIPAFRGLLRAVESRFYQQLALEAPILDVGCGDGHFAQMSFDQPLDVGIDPWWNPLKKGQRSGMYQLVLQGMGDTMPFPDHFFSTVISNSVLEHIPDVQSVLNEIGRVLKVDGRLVITVPSHWFTEFLGGAAFFEKLGAEGVAEQYRRFFNRISRHAHTDSAEVWAERLARAGFVVERWQYYFSKEALRALEWGHVQGVPAAISHALTGHWILGPYESNLKRTEQWVRPFFEEPFPDQGAYIFFVARKVSDGDVPAFLPTAQPFTFSQPEPIAIPTGEQLTEADELPSIADVPPVVEEEIPSVPLVAPAVVTAGLIGITLLFAMLGQAALISQPDLPSSGLWLFGGAFAGILAIWWWTRPKRTATKQPSRQTWRLTDIPRQRWLIVPALFLSLLATRPVSAPNVAEQNPFFAILLWSAGIGLAFYALHKSGEQLNLWQRWRNISRWEWIAIIALFYFAFTIRIVQLTEHPFIINGTEANLGLEAERILQGELRSPFATGWMTNPTLSLYLLSLPIRFLGSSALSIRFLAPIAGTLTVLALYWLGKRLWNPQTGLLSALFLAGSHTHIHYSRLGMTNIWDPLIMLLAIGLLILAQQRGKRLGWLLVGVCAGITPYFFTTAHLFPLILLLGGLAWLGFDRSAIWEQKKHWLAATLLALVIALPQLLFYRQQPDIFMAQANSLGIVQSGWLVQEVAKTGQATSQIWQSQIWRSFLAFNATADTSLAYNAGGPLLSFFPALFFVLGLGVAVWQLRQPRHFWLVIWWLVTVVFAGILLLMPPASHRFLVAMPAVCLLAASSFVWLGQKFADSFHLTNRQWFPILIGLVLLFAINDLSFYFGKYRAGNTFGDRNSEIAARVADYLNSLEGNSWTAYFYGAPNIYIDFPTIPFLTRDFQPDVNLYDAIEQGVPAIAPNVQNLVFIFTPERAPEITILQAAFPTGELRTFEGKYANPLFYAYEVPH